MSQKIEIAARAFTPALLVRSSLKEEARTVELIFSTGAAVKRYSWDEGFYMERLSMDPSAVDLSRLNAGASLLNTHNQSDMADRLGAVVPGSARVEEGKGYCTVQISRNPEGERLMVDLRDGLSLPISIGYRIHSYLKEEGGEDALPTYTATRWEPIEVSAVPVPADPGAHARADAPASRHIVPVTHRRAEGAADRPESTMPDNSETLERGRADEIMLISERHDIPIRLARKAVSEGKTVAEFREIALDHKRREQSKNETFPVAPMGYDANARALSDRLGDAIIARLQPGVKLEADARAFAGLSMAEMARVALHARNEATTGVRASELISRALHTTSDFGLALSNVANRLVLDGYQAAPSQVRRIARESSARDFRAKTSIRLAEADSLERVNEHGEFRRGTWNETGESYALGTYGRIFGLTRQALINDDLDLLSQVPSRLGEYASRFESSFLAKLIEQPAKMSDGKNFFHADHGNLAGTGTALSVASLGAARLALRRQRGVGGEVIAVEPKFLLVPPELETLAEQVLADVNASKIEDVNPFAGRLELVVEPHLTNQQAWYLAATPAQTALEYAYLEGESGPQIETRQGFDIDGTEWKVRLDFGGGFVDHRGIYRNPGVAP